MQNGAYQTRVLKVSRENGTISANLNTKPGSAQDALLHQPPGPEMSLPGDMAAGSRPAKRGTKMYSKPATGEFTHEQERMMIEHLPIVRYLARRIHERLPQHVDIEDLVSAGVLGLIDAFQKFDPEKRV